MRCHHRRLVVQAKALLQAGVAPGSWPERYRRDNWRATQNWLLVLFMLPRTSAPWRLELKLRLHAVALADWSQLLLRGALFRGEIFARNTAAGLVSQLLRRYTLATTTV